MFDHKDFYKHSLTKDIWDIPWVRDAFNEDNDSSEESEGDESEYDDEEEKGKLFKFYFY